MALSDTNKTDFLFKKSLKTARTSSDKAYYEESISTKNLVHQADILMGCVPSTPPVATTDVVKCYTLAGDGRLALVKDTTVADSKAWKSNLENWIPPSFGTGYFVRIYESDGTTEIPTTDSSDWLFDYESGVLTFQGDCPDASGIYLEAYQYIGVVGLTSCYSTLVHKTTENITLYVRSGGNDDNDGLTVGNAKLTLQNAIDALPKYVMHDLVVDLGEGDLGPADIAGFTIDGGTLTVRGTLGQPTLATGTPTGTADGGSTTQLVDSGQSWTTNELRGVLLLVDGEYRVVRNNDGTTINLVAPYSGSVNGKAYEILEQKTSLTGASRFYSSATLTSTACITNSTSISIQNIKMDGVTIGFYGAYTGGMELSRCAVDNSVYGIVYQTIFGEINMFDCYVGNSSKGYYIVKSHFLRQAEGIYAFNNSAQGVSIDGLNGCSEFEHWCMDDNGVGVQLSFIDGIAQVKEKLTIYNSDSYGLYAYNVGYIDLDDVDIQSNGNHGIFIDGCKNVDIDSGTISSNAGWGLLLKKCTNADLSGTITVASNSSGGLRAEQLSYVNITNMDGSNTGDYGVEVGDMSKVKITSATGITGNTSDATVDRGSTGLTWAGDFSSDGDLVYSAAHAAYMERED
jgi:hypothetical protein